MANEMHTNSYTGPGLASLMDIFAVDLLDLRLFTSM